MSGDNLKILFFPPIKSHSFALFSILFSIFSRTKLHGPSFETHHSSPNPARLVRNKQSVQITFRTTSAIHHRIHSLLWRLLRSISSTLKIYHHNLYILWESPPARTFNAKVLNMKCILRDVLSLTHTLLVHSAENTKQKCTQARTFVCSLVFLLKINSKRCLKGYFHLMCF